MPFEGLLRRLGFRDRESEDHLRAIRERRDLLGALSDDELKSIARGLPVDSSVTEIFALTAVVAERVLKLRMFDVQLLGALALQQGHIAEMQTGEGKTLTAVPAVIWYARQGSGIHVLTANDYLARRDADWMRGIYEWFGLSVGHISQAMAAAERRAAYNCDITYATANEVGFDYLRDCLARDPAELVQRPFAFACIDEADSILIDEARIPLVIAGGASVEYEIAWKVDGLVASLHACADFFVDQFSRNVQLTDAGIRRVEQLLGCGNLFAEDNLHLLTAVQDALHARVLLRRDIDYIVKHDSIEMVDELKGRIAQNRRWPAGLQCALEAKERVHVKPQGRILGSITVQMLAGLYERICGMTGTAATQAEEFWKVYELPVTVIPTNRPVIRHDLPDVLFPTRYDRDRAVVKEIEKAHATGRPVLVGTASVQASEALSRQLSIAAIPHTVLNAKNDETEAAIIAQAGAPGAITISTNMAGRGTDILLGGNPPLKRDEVVALGGLYVIGTTRHEARRIDNQLRGRAGRQGDPGSSRFFISLEDDLLVRYGISENPDVESVQRTAESQNLEIRQTLWKYESSLEHHRREAQDFRRRVLLSSDWSVRSLLSDEQWEELSQLVALEALEKTGRQITLACFDDLWADYLANVAELRGGIHWVSWGGRDPLYEFLMGVQEIFDDFWSSLREEVGELFAKSEILDGQVAFPKDDRFDRGATWTYLTNDQPFGTLGERITKATARALSRLAR